MYFVKTNSLKLQTEELGNKVEMLILKANGAGCAFVQVYQNYYVPTVQTNNNGKGYRNFIRPENWYYWYYQYYK